jgi:hypothetical protein
MLKGDLKTKLSETLSELESALKAWDESAKDEFADTESPNQAKGFTGRPNSSVTIPKPTYERALIKKIYRQLQELSEE